jgi:glycosyltransferase involved in cell wall biosynthesis
MYGLRGKVGHYALKNADHVIVQTEKQRELLREKYGREGIVIRNPIELRESDHAAPAGVPGIPGVTSPYVLWVGRADRSHKRPAAAIEAAVTLPDIQFVMIMNRFDSEVSDEVTRKCPPNVRILEWVPYEQIDAYYRHARLFLSTSVFEGFPNTFLQSGKFGVPVVSLDVDPDGMLAQHRCGLCAKGNMTQLVDNIRMLWNDDAERAVYSKAIRQYVHDFHEAGGRVRELKAVLQNVLEAEKPPEPAKKGGSE